MVSVEAIIQSTLTGLLQGGIYALLGVGLTLIFGVMRIINFAQADFMMLGMYVGFFVFAVFGGGPLVSVAIILPLFFAVGVVLYASVIEPLIGEDEESQLVLTFGLLLILQNAALGLFGSDHRLVNVGWSTTAVYLGQFSANQAKLLTFIFAAGLLSLTYGFLNYTMLGKAIKATANDTELAQYSGINTNKVYALSFGLGITLTAAAGAFVVTYFPVFPNVAFEFIIIMFLVVVLGGMGNVKGAAVAGLLIGIVEQVVSLWLPLQMQPAFAYVLFFLVIMFRPQGLFGDPTIQ